MKEIKHRPSFLDSNIILSSPNCNCDLVRINTQDFMLMETVSKSVIFTFRSKMLADFFTANPNLLAIDVALIAVAVIEGDVSSLKELRLTLTHGITISLNERDEIHRLQRLTGSAIHVLDTYSAECLWGIASDGFLASFRMSNRFAQVVEKYSQGQNQLQVLKRFWLDYTSVTTNSKHRKLNPPFLVHGEFTTFVAYPDGDGVIIFDLPDQKDH